MKRVTIQAPFTDGLVTDVPPHLLGPRMAARAENMIVIDGAARRRRGWKFAAPNATAHAKAIIGVRSADFALADTSRRIVTTEDGAFDDEQDPANLIQVLGTGNGAITYDILPRCVYRDELILCHRSGQRGIRRYAGAGWNDGTNDSFKYEHRQFTATNKPTIAMNTTAGSAEFSYTLPGTNDGNIVALDALTGSQSGWYVIWRNTESPHIASKIANVYSTSKGTLLNAISAGSAWSTTSTAKVSTVGVAYPAVSVYSAGTITLSSGTATGTGTEWVNGAWGRVDQDGASSSDHEPVSLLFTNGSTTRHRSITGVSSDTQLTINGGTLSGVMPYHITRGLPFADACVHRGSLCGTGVAQFQNRVYICPPGWDLESPPGSVPPLRLVSTSFDNADPNYFLIDFIDVPTSVDTDPCVAVLSSPGPLLVLKTDACHGIYGDYPNFTQSLIAQGAGCVDLRSTVDSRWGQFWAGKDGVHQYINGRVVDITEGRINATWRNLVATFYNTSGFYCSMGQSGDKLLVSIGNSTTGECLSYDLATRRWDGFLTNHKALFFDAPTDEAKRLVWAAGADMADKTRLRDSGPMLYGSGPVNDGALLTTAAPPVFTATTGTGMAQHQGIDGLSKMVDLAVSAEVEGPATGHARLTPSAEIAGGIDDENENSTQSLPAIVPTASVSLVQRRRGRINRKGRTFAVKVDTTGTPTGNAQNADYDVKVHQITASFRESRERA